MTDPTLFYGRSSLRSRSLLCLSKTQAAEMNFLHSNNGCAKPDTMPSEKLLIVFPVHDTVNKNRIGEIISIE